MEVFFACITAVAYGGDYYFIRKGLLTDPYPLPATFVTLTPNFSFFLLMFFCFVPPELLQWRLISPVATMVATGCVVVGIALLIGGR